MSSPSTLTGQQLLDYARLFPWTTPAVGVAGYGQEPTISFLDDIIKKIMNKANPWKWNQVNAPSFFTQPYQQDYPTSISQNDMGWLQYCTMVDINNATQLPPVQPPVNCVQNILPTSNCGYPSKICWITNSAAFTAVWPGPNVLFVNPLSALGGGPASNPITAITDTNGNIQVVTQYGTTGSAMPQWPPTGAATGTQTVDGSVTWSLQDPNGIAFRLDRLATFNSNVWQILPIYQRKPPNIVSLSQTIAPIPDDLSYLVKQGFLTYCYKLADSEKFIQEFEQWMQSVQEALGASDREYQEFGFSPQQSMVSGGPTIGGYGYPGWMGWSSDGY